MLISCVNAHGARLELTLRCCVVIEVSAGLSQQRLARWGAFMLCMAAELPLACLREQVCQAARPPRVSYRGRGGGRHLHTAITSALFGGGQCIHPIKSAWKEPNGIEDGS